MCNHEISRSQISQVEWWTYPKDGELWLAPIPQKLLGFAQRSDLLYRTQTSSSLTCSTSWKEQFSSNFRLSPSMYLSVSSLRLLIAGSHPVLWSFSFFCIFEKQQNVLLPTPRSYKTRGMARWSSVTITACFDHRTHLALGKRNSSLWPYISSVLWGSASPSRNQEKRMR